MPSDIFCATIRALTSVPPPAEKPTIMRMGRSGYLAGWAAVCVAPMTSAAIAKADRQSVHSARTALTLLSVLAVVIERHGVELEAMLDQAVAQLARHFRLQALDLLGLEFDHLAGAQID